jgi:glycosyltransferase involved in cell wall biosynthesis
MPATVAITAYNAERKIGEIIASVLKQASRDFELICLDDGSTDRTRKIAAEVALRDGCVRVVLQSRVEPNPTLNRGIELVPNEWVVSDSRRCCHDAESD